MKKDLKAALVENFSRLPPPEQQTMLAFSEFLLARTGQQPESTAVQASETSIPEPLDIPRPGKERVVAAVKRLSQTYPMLDKSRMLGATSDLVTQHVVQGREAGEVIDELEQAFRDEYQQLKSGYR